MTMYLPNPDLHPTGAETAEFIEAHTAVEPGERPGAEDGAERKGIAMKIVVIGGSGLIGSKLVAELRAHGHDAAAASPATGVDTLTGEGLDDALDGATVVVDVSNSPSFEDAAVLEFFETSTRNLLAAEATAGVTHHVALSVVGTERLGESGYFRAKLAQETLIASSSAHYTIVHATQFFEFLDRIVDDATDGDTVRVAPVLIQPMAADDVAGALADVAVGPPMNGVVDIAGPEQFRLDELARRNLAHRQAHRRVVADPHARYFGAELGEHTLVPTAGARLGNTRLEHWLGPVSARTWHPIPEALRHRAPATRA